MLQLSAAACWPCSCSYTCHGSARSLADAVALALVEITAVTKLAASAADAAADLAWLLRQ